MGNGMHDEVRSLDRQWEDAVNSGDAATAASLYADDALLLPPDTEPIHGRAGIEAFFVEFVKLQPSISLETLRIEEGGGLAANGGRYKLELRLPGAPEPSTDIGQYVGVFKRQADGSLKYIMDTWNTNAPLPASGP
jgi:ketosteroid isomerase-like protein